MHTHDPYAHHCTHCDAPEGTACTTATGNPTPEPHAPRRRAAHAARKADEGYAAMRHPAHPQAPAGPAPAIDREELFVRTISHRDGEPLNITYGYGEYGTTIEARHDSGEVYDARMLNAEGKVVATYYRPIDLELLTAEMYEHLQLTSSFQEPLPRPALTVGDLYPDTIADLQAAWEKQMKSPGGRIVYWDAAEHERRVAALLGLADHWLARAVWTTWTTPARRGTMPAFGMELETDPEEAELRFLRTTHTRYVGWGETTSEHYYEEDTEEVHTTFAAARHELDDTVSLLTVNLPRLAAAPVALPLDTSHPL